MSKGNKKSSRAQTFRAGVGAVILNQKGMVLSLERKDYPDQWQLPQGGLKAGESPQEAVYREITEETGIQANDLQMVSEEPRLLAYELPEEARSKKTGRGQVQYWYLFQFIGAEESITLGNKQEFTDWKWISMSNLLSEVIAFRKPVYQDLARHFKSYFKVS